MSRKNRLSLYVFTGCLVILASFLFDTWVEAQAPSFLRQRNPVARQSLKLYSGSQGDAAQAGDPVAFGQAGRIMYDPDQDCILLYTQSGWECAGSGSGNISHLEQVRVATATALAANTSAGSGVGKTLTADANGALTVDGVSVALNDRVLVKNEGDPDVDNGVYKVTQVGDGSNPWILTRAVDLDQDSEMVGSIVVASEEGTANADKLWILTTDNAITVDTTAISWTEISAGSSGDQLWHEVAGQPFLKPLAGVDANVVVGADANYYRAKIFGYERCDNDAGVCSDPIFTDGGTIVGEGECDISNTAGDVGDTVTNGDFELGTNEDATGWTEAASGQTSANGTYSTSLQGGAWTDTFGGGGRTDKDVIAGSYSMRLGDGWGGAADQNRTHLRFANYGGSPNTDQGDDPAATSSGDGISTSGFPLTNVTQVQFKYSSENSGDYYTLYLEAVRGAQVVSLWSDATVGTGKGTTTVTVDTSAMGFESGDWTGRFRVEMTRDTWSASGDDHVRYAVKCKDSCSNMFGPWPECAQYAQGHLQTGPDIPCNNPVASGHVPYCAKSADTGGFGPTILENSGGLGGESCQCPAAGGAYSTYAGECAAVDNSCICTSLPNVRIDDVVTQSADTTTCGHVAVRGRVLARSDPYLAGNSIGVWGEAFIHDAVRALDSFIGVRGSVRVENGGSPSNSFDEATAMHAEVNVGTSSTALAAPLLRGVLVDMTSARDVNAMFGIDIPAMTFSGSTANVRAHLHIGDMTGTPSGNFGILVESAHTNRFMGGITTLNTESPDVYSSAAVGALTVNGVITQSASAGTNTFLNDVQITSADLTVTTGDITTTGAIQTTAGAITADLGNITATAGNITATAGDLVATAGDVTASAGTVTGGVLTTTSYLLLTPTTEPTGTNGRMYYDSGTNKFRCYIAGAWTECSATDGSGAARQVAFWTDSDTLSGDASFIYEADGDLCVGAASCSAQLAVNSGGTNHTVVGANASFATYNVVSLNGSLADPGFMGMTGGGGADANLYFNPASGGQLQFRNGGSSAVMAVLEDDGDLCVGASSCSYRIYAEDSAQSVVRFTSTNTVGIAAELDSDSGNPWALAIGGSVGDANFPSGDFVIHESTVGTWMYINAGDGAIRFPNLVSCDTIDTDASGNLTCGTDAGGAGLWTDAGAYTYLTATGDDLCVGSSAAGSCVHPLYVRRDTDSAEYIFVENRSSGTSVWAALRAMNGNNISTILGSAGHGYTTWGDLEPNHGFLYNDGAKGMIFLMNNAAAELKIATGGLTTKFIFEADGDFCINMAAGCDDILDIEDAGDTATGPAFKNGNNTSSAQAVWKAYNNANDLMQMGIASQVYGGYGAIVASRSFLYANDATGMVIMADNASAPIVFAAGGNAEDARFEADGDFRTGRHTHSNGTAPTLSACGTTPSVTGSDLHGKVTIGTGVTTSCTVTFAAAYTGAPACVIAGDNTAVTYAATTTTTALTITSSADMDSDVISYICMGD